MVRRAGAAGSRAMAALQDCETPREGMPLLEATLPKVPESVRDARNGFSGDGLGSVVLETSRIKKPSETPKACNCALAGLTAPRHTKPRLAITKTSNSTISPGVQREFCELVFGAIRQC